MTNAAAHRKVFHRYLTEPQEKSLFTTVKQYAGIHARRDYAWMLLLRQTGIRVNPLAELTVDDARQALKSGYLHLRGETNKGGREHEVFLNTKAQAALRDLLAIRAEMGHIQEGDAPLIMSRKHQGMSVRSFQARMKAWCLAAGLDCQASPHWFRHTLAKRIMQRSTAKDPRGIVQAALGHGHIQSTLIYTLPDKEEVAAAMREAA